MRTREAQKHPDPTEHWFKGNTCHVVDCWWFAGDLPVDVRLRGYGLLSAALTRSRHFYRWALTYLCLHRYYFTVCYVPGTVHMYVLQDNVLDSLNPELDLDWNPALPSESGSMILMTKNLKKKKIFCSFLCLKLAINLALGLHAGCLSYNRSLQPSKENIQHFWWVSLPSWIRIHPTPWLQDGGCIS